MRYEGYTLHDSSIDCNLLLRNLGFHLSASKVAYIYNCNAGRYENNDNNNMWVTFSNRTRITYQHIYLSAFLAGSMMLIDPSAYCLTNESSDST